MTKQERINVLPYADDCECVTRDERAEGLAEREGR